MYIILVIIILIIYIILLVILYPFILIFSGIKDCFEYNNNIDVSKRSVIIKKIFNGYPHLSTSMYDFTYDNIEYNMFYYRTNTVMNKKYPTLIFIHGSFTTSVTWLKQIDLLMRHNENLTIYAFDIIGAGFSSNVNLDYDEHLAINKYMINNFIKDNRIEEQSSEIIFISSSYGGLLNLEYIIDYPTKSIIYNTIGILPIISKYTWYLALIAK